MTSPLEISGWRHVYSGKVRDLYESKDPSLSHLILVVASDRVSAFDRVLEPAIPNKGKHLTTLTNWWFERLPVANHLSNEVPIPEEVVGRAVVAKKLKMFPIECVVRGYLSGSAWKEYQAKGEICGVELPEGLTFGGKLSKPIFTPAFKAELGDHDENISFEKVVELVGLENAEQLRALSIEIFKKASELAEQAGLILADTKFEFGTDPATGQMVLGDEALTPDSSRYWSKSAWEKGERNDSFDKQGVRNWLAANWDQSGTPPTLPPEIVAETERKYAELVELLTSEPFKVTLTDPLGLHARPAAEIASLAKQLEIEVMLGNASGKWVKGSSPLLLLTLKLKQGDDLFVSFSSGSTASQNEFLVALDAIMKGAKP
jgi:phosphoribosylaminoimidazole-succinocarboxamide synthase